MQKRIEKNRPATYAQADAVVHFWRDAGRRAWFTKSPVFDDAFRERFFDLHFEVSRREHDDWLDDAYASLGLILMVDQFPRNVFRGSAHSYATDGLACFYARTALQRNWIDRIEDELRLFILVPFIHSENLNEQRYGVELYRRYSPANLEFAIEHCGIVQRFGRLPHRNPALGRTTTPAEQQFLDSGGFAG